MKGEGLVGARAQSLRMFYGIREEHSRRHGQSCLLLHLANDACLEALMRIDAAGRNLCGDVRHSPVVEDEQFRAPALLACDVCGDTLAHEVAEEMAAVAPDRGPGLHGEPVAANEGSGFVTVPGDLVLPLVGLALDRSRLDEMAFVNEIRVAGARMFRDAQRAHDPDVDPGLLARFANRRVLDGLALVDATAGDGGPELWLVRNVEDEELVGAGCRMLTGDVDDDVRPNGQLCCARSFALWARLAA